MYIFASFKTVSSPRSYLNIKLWRENIERSKCDSFNSPPNRNCSGNGPSDCSIGNWQHYHLWYHNTTFSQSSSEYRIECLRCLILQCTFFTFPFLCVLLHFALSTIQCGSCIYLKCFIPYQIEQYFKAISTNVIVFLMKFTKLNCWVLVPEKWMNLSCRKAEDKEQTNSIGR